MKKCLIVVDYQNDFVSGTLGFQEAVALEDEIAKKIRQYREDGGEVLFTFDTHCDNYLNTQEGRKLPVTHCIRGTNGHMLYGKIADMLEESDMKFFKETFGSGELYEYLKNTSFESIELAGVVSNICVISNAVLAKTAQPEAHIRVDARCVASNDKALNAAAMDIMESIQIEVVNR